MKKYMEPGGIMIISGGQNGVDQAALRAAKAVGFKTGGYIPKGWKTLDGPRPNFEFLYNMIESKSANYQERTAQNVEYADITIRIASNLESSGEKCTYKAIKKYNRSYFDVHVPEELNEETVLKLVNFIELYADDDIIINVAGNSEKTSPGIGKKAEEFLLKIFTTLKQRGELIE